MDVNDCHSVGDTSDDTLLFLADLIEVSRTDEQMVYREAEIDELWRLLDAACAAGGADATRRRAEVMAVHDMLEQPGNAAAAAARLRALVETAEAHQP